MALKLTDTFTAANTQKTASNCKGNIFIGLGAATVNDTTGAYSATQVGVVSIYERLGSLSANGSAETTWRPVLLGVAVPDAGSIELYFTDYHDIRVVLTALSVGAALPVKIVDGSPA